jgi:hypothetical protein
LIVATLQGRLPKNKPSTPNRRKEPLESAELIAVIADVTGRSKSR